MEGFKELALGICELIDDILLEEEKRTRKIDWLEEVRTGNSEVKQLLLSSVSSSTLWDRQKYREVKDFPSVAVAKHQRKDWAEFVTEFRKMVSSTEKELEWDAIVFALTQTCTTDVFVYPRGRSTGIGRLAWISYTKNYIMGVDGHLTRIWQNPINRK